MDQNLYQSIFIKRLDNVFTNLYIPDINYKHIVDDPLSRS